MGLFQRLKENRRKRRADRKRRRAERNRARANRLDNRASELAPEKREKATLVATDEQGREVRQRVELEKQASLRRNARLMTLEAQVSELTEKLQDLEEDHEELEQELEEAYDKLGKRENGSLMLSKGALSAANAVLSAINVGDVVQNRWALVASEAADAWVDIQELDEVQQQWFRVARVLLKGYAYYNPKQGLQSVITTDQANKLPIPGPGDLQ